MQLRNVCVLAEFPIEMIDIPPTLKNGGIVSADLTLEAILGPEVLNAWRAVQGRISFLFPRVNKGTICTDLGGVDGSDVDTCDPSKSFSIALKSLLEFEAPLPGEIGSIRPSRPPPAKHFTRHVHL